MKHRDINPEEAIDRILTGLRDAEPLEGMQQRVLRRARERAGARQRWSLQSSRATTHSWVVAAAAVAVLALAASWTLVHRHRAPREIARAPVNLPQPNAPIAQTHLASVHVTPALPAREPTNLSTQRSAAPVEPMSDEDALAISEMLAPSKPAPPLPLTRQEKLLAEVVRKGDPEQVADLKPEVRAKQIEIAKAEFHAFFESPFLIPAPVKGNE